MKRLPLILLALSAFGVGVLVAPALFERAMAAPDPAMSGTPATVAGWTQRGSGNKWAMVFRDADYHALSSGSVWDTLGVGAASDPVAVDVYYDEFADFVGKATAWTITESSAAATEASDTARPTALLITNSGTDDHLVQLQLIGEGFQASSTKPFWFEARVQVDDATQSDMIVGLCITDTSLVAAMSDGIYFRKDDGDANIDFVTEKNLTETAADTTSDLANSTWVRLGIWWDGTTATPYVNGTAVTGASTTNIPDDEALTISFAVQNGETAARVMKVDYVKVAQIR